MQWCVIANTNDEDWVYGPFETREAAEDFCDKAEALIEKHGGDVDYQVCSLLAPKDYP